MEITDVETIKLSCPVPDDEQWRLSGIRSDSIMGATNDMVIVRLHTDAGHVGIGEPSPYGGAEALETAIETVTPQLVGEDPHDVARLSTPAVDQRRGAARYALAGIDQACWDLIGKAAGEPVSNLLGGRYVESVPVYASGGIDWDFVEDPDLLVAEAEEYVAAGFPAFKFRIGPDERFVEAVAALDAAVGDELELIVEGNARFTLPEAVRMGERLRQFDPLWFEEPLDTSDLDGYRRLRAALPGIRITGGEMATSFDRLAPWLDAGAYDVVQPDANVMGITETKRVADYARYHDVPCVPHSWHNAVTMAANLHVVAAIPNRELLEWQRTWHYSAEPFRTDILVEPIAFENGELQVPDGPGLGIELDEDVLAEYPYQEGPVQQSWDGPGGEARPI